MSDQEKEQTPTVADRDVEPIERPVDFDQSSQEGIDASAKRAAQIANGGSDDYARDVEGDGVEKEGDGPHEPDGTEHEVTGDGTGQPAPPVESLTGDGAPIETAAPGDTTEDAARRAQEEAQKAAEGTDGAGNVPADPQGQPVHPNHPGPGQPGS